MKFSKEILVLLLVIIAIVAYGIIKSRDSYNARAKAASAKVIDKTSELANRTKEAATDLKNKASNLAEDAKVKAQEVYDNAKTTVRDAYDNIKPDKKIVVTDERSIEVK